MVCQKQWQDSLELWLLQHYFGFTKEFCPAVLIFRGTRHPLLFRFYQPFRDFKHGRTQPLRRLEQRMFAELGIEVSDAPDSHPVGALNQGDSAPV